MSGSSSAACVEARPCSRVRFPGFRGGRCTSVHTATSEMTPAGGAPDPRGRTSTRRSTLDSGSETMITVIHEQRETRLAQAQASGESLWVARDEVEHATGWQWKPEGFRSRHSASRAATGCLGAAS